MADRNNRNIPGQIHAALDFLQYIDNRSTPIMSDLGQNMASPLTDDESSTRKVALQTLKKYLAGENSYEVRDEPRITEKGVG